MRGITQYLLSASDQVILDPHQHIVKMVGLYLEHDNKVKTWS